MIAHIKYSTKIIFRAQTITLDWPKKRKKRKENGLTCEAQTLLHTLQKATTIVTKS